MIWLLLACSSEPTTTGPDGHVEAPEGAEAPDGAPEGPTLIDPNTLAPTGDVAGVPTPDLPPGEAGDTPDLPDLVTESGVPVRGGALDEGTKISGTIEGSKLAQVRFQTMDAKGIATVVHFAPAVDGRFEVLAPAGLQSIYISAAEVPSDGYIGVADAYGALGDPLDVGTDAVEVAFALGDQPDWSKRILPLVDEVLDPRLLPLPEGAPPEEP